MKIKNWIAEKEKKIVLWLLSYDFHYNLRQIEKLSRLCFRAIGSAVYLRYKVYLSRDETAKK